jgi:hypothetical protein
VSQHIIDILIQNGGNPNLKNNTLRSPLTMAIEEKKKEAIVGILKVWRAYHSINLKSFDIKGE